MIERLLNRKITFIHVQEVRQFRIPAGLSEIHAAKFALHLLGFRDQIAFPLLEAVQPFPFQNILDGVGSQSKLFSNATKWMLDLVDDQTTNDGDRHSGVDFPQTLATVETNWGTERPSRSWDTIRARTSSEIMINYWFAFVCFGSAGHSPREEFFAYRMSDVSSALYVSAWHSAPVKIVSKGFVHPVHHFDCF